MKFIYKIFRKNPDGREDIMVMTSGLGIFVNLILATLCSVQEQEYSQIDAVCRPASCEAKGTAIHGGFVMITKNPMQLKAFIKN